MQYSDGTALTAWRIVYLGDASWALLFFANLDMGENNKINALIIRP